MKQRLDVASLNNRLGRHLELGLTAIDKVVADGRPLCFTTWVREIERASSPLDDPKTAPRPDVLWKLLMKDPDIAAVYEQSLREAQDALGSVLSPGARLTIEITGVDKERWPEVRLEAPLRFVAGKDGRLECAPVQARVTFTVKDLQSRVEEAARIGADLEDVQVFPDQRRVEVRVESLNQAYTVSSTRLEPQRRSHTGRIFAKLAWVTGGMMNISLEEIRTAAESGEWAKRRADLESTLGARRA